MANTVNKCIFFMQCCLWLISTSSYGGQWSVNSALMSQRMSDGIVVSEGRPVLQLSSEWNSNSGVFLNGLIFAGAQDADKAGSKGYALQWGYFYPVSDTMALELSLNQHGYFDDEDFLQYGALFYLSKRWSLDLRYAPDYNPNYMVAAYDKTYVGFNWQPLINDRYFAKLDFGRYRFANEKKEFNSNLMVIGLGMNLNRQVQVSLTHHLSKQDAVGYASDYIELDLTNRHWVLELSYLIF